MTSHVTGGFKEASEEARFDWIIPDFFTLPVGQDYCYRSPSLYFADSSWFFVIYPDGVNQSAKSISFYVRRENLDPPQRISILAGITRIDGIVEERLRATYSYNKTNFEHGCFDFIQRCDLVQERNCMAPGDVLTITCVLKHEIPDTNEHTTVPLRLSYLEKLSMHFQDLFDSKKNWNATIRVKHREFRVHKSVLIARSTVFRYLFMTSMPRKNTITIFDCDPDSFDDYLKYLYTGKIEGIPPSKALDLYVTTLKYEGEDLRSWCIQTLVQSVTVDNMWRIIEVGKQYGEPMLLVAAQMFFDKSIVEVWKSSQFRRVFKDNPDLVLLLQKRQLPNFDFQQKLL